MGSQSFGRKIWDVEEYAEKARSRRNDSKSEGSQTDKKQLGDRNKLLQQIGNDRDNDNNIFVGDKAWFSCELCRRRFKDNLKLVEHLNSKEHLSKLGMDHENLDREVTLQEVIERLKKLRERVSKLESGKVNIATSYTLEDRVKRRKKLEESIRERRKEKRKKKKEIKDQRNDEKEDHNEDQYEDQADIMNVMGFSGFKSG